MLPRIRNLLPHFVSSTLPIRTLVLVSLVLCLPVNAMSAEKSLLKALVIDGQMNKHHNMAIMSEAVADYLEQSGLFEVARVSTPPAGAEMGAFAPDFGQYDVVVINYDGDEWSESTKTAFENYVRDGGGMVTVHSTDNAFPEWQAFLDMTGVGGWGGRDETWGPAVHWGENGLEYDHGPGKAFHPPQHVFPVTIRDAEHPVTRGLPREWLHGKDELYSCLRGPAKNMEVLATGFADPEQKNASNRHEPVLMALRYGAGRVFHTTLGHVNRNAEERPASIACVGFISTLQRGAEWAATGAVTQPVPEDFPGPEAVSTRSP